MYPLVEAIKVINGIPQNLTWHQDRYNYSIESFFGHKSKIKLGEILNIPDQYKTGTVKARLLYDDGTFNINYENYTPRIIRSLKLIENDEIDYSLKYANRSMIMKMLEERGDCDDILIVKKGKVTDSSIANIVFYDDDKWFTPEYPLLRGTARERLLSEKKIFLRDIHVDDLKLFAHFRLINSMLDFDKQKILDISNIK